MFKLNKDEISFQSQLGFIQTPFKLHHRLLGFCE